MLSQNDWNFNNIGTKFELDEVIPKFETEVRADANGEIIKNRDGSERRFNTDKIIGWKYNVTIKDGQFKKKSTQVSVDNPEALVDNDYIQAMDQVPVTFDNLQATMISSTMYYKADAIHLVDVKQKLPKTGSNKIMELFLTVTGIGLLLTLKGLKYYGKDK